MCVWPPARDHYISNGIIRQGTWLLANDESLRQHMVCTLANASRHSMGEAWIVDVGTNIGTFTLPLLAAGFNVLSFEAFAPNAALVAASIQKLAATGTAGRSILVSKAVTTPDGPKALCMHNSADGRNFGGASVDSAASSRDDTCSDLTRTTTIDTEIAAHALGNVVGMKMDIEGHEHFALQGAQQLFAPSSALQLVFVEAVKNRVSVLDFLHNHSFPCHRLKRIQHDYLCKVHRSKRHW
jgi:FkbM family methyltransferase